MKDRAAYGMIKGALDRGELRKGMRLVEATSGNTGIALAMIARIFNIPITLVMPESATAERVKTMQAYGAEVVLTPADKTIEYSREYAEELSKQPEYLMLNQFGNDDNWGMHHKTTGPEIWRDTAGKITHFVSSMGTTGTIMGTSRYLKEQSEAVQIVGVQPTDGSRIPGIRRWSPEFLPAIYDPKRVDQIIDVSQEEAQTMMQRLAQEEADQATSLYDFTRLINDVYSYSQKLQLVQDMWQIAFSDEQVDKYEEHLIRKVSDLIYVSHSGSDRGPERPRPPPKWRSPPPKRGSPPPGVLIE